MTSERERFEAWVRETWGIEPNSKKLSGETAARLECSLVAWEFRAALNRPPKDTAPLNGGIIQIDGASALGGANSTSRESLENSCESGATPEPAELYNKPVETLQLAQVEERRNPEQECVGIWVQDGNGTRSVDRRKKPPLTEPAQVERVAKRIYDDRHANLWENTSEEKRAKYRKVAISAIAACTTEK